jgi:hypothetical protein
MAQIYKQNQRPKGVTILACLYFLSGILEIIGAVLLPTLIGEGAFTEKSLVPGYNIGIINAVVPIMYVFGIVALVFGYCMWIGKRFLFQMYAGYIFVHGFYSVFIGSVIVYTGTDSNALLNILSGIGAMMFSLVVTRYLRMPTIKQYFR